MAPSDNAFLYPYFLGAFAENDQVFENLLLEFFRDHAYWRRNFHPEDQPPIPTNAPYRDLYNQFLARMQQELHTLSADLKRSIPYFSPRYMGQMASDFLLPSLLAQIMTSFYHPNNVCDDTIPTTMEKETQVGYQLATMFGMPTKSDDQRHAWGHITSGGTTANYEGLWYLQTAKFLPITIAKTFIAFHLELEDTGPQQKCLSEYSQWQLLNFSLQEVVSLWRKALSFIYDNRKEIPAKAILEKLRAESLDQQGQASFNMSNPNIHPPKVLVSRAASHSWRKAVNLLGIGCQHLIKIPTDSRMRLDLEHLETYLDSCVQSHTPVLVVVANLGTLNFGSIDPIHHLVRLRKQYRRQGLFFGLHIDAAWGGYLTAMFRNPDGSLVEKETLHQDLKYFPQSDTFKAFAALPQADSISVDPQKLGYLSFPCGAFISSEGGVLDFFWLKQKMYENLDFSNTPLGTKFAKLTHFSLEGAKPGATAAAAYITHRCIPLHREGFGKVLKLTMEASEYFFEKIKVIQEALADLVHLVIPFRPDTNILCFAINPKGNSNLAIMNHFSKKIFKHLKFDPNLPLQAHKFFVSSTILDRHQLTDAEARRVCDLLEIDPAGYRDHIEDRTSQARSLFLFRHAVLNPWLLFKDDTGQENYIDRYFAHIVSLIKQELSEAIRRGKPNPP